MKHVKAFFMKFIPSFILLYVILSLFYGMSFGMTFLITLSLTSSSYIIGDFVVLPRTNNVVSTIIDFIFAFLVIWACSFSLTLRGNLITMSLVAAAGVAIFEILFHRYMANQIITKMKYNYTRPSQLRFQTEASEEFAPDKRTLKNDEHNSNKEEE